MRYSKLMMAAVLGLMGTQMAGATPTAEEAAELGKSLTPFGAIKAGNKEGTIPEWTGGVCTPPAGYKPHHGLVKGGGPYVDPFAGDKPLFKITAANMAQYADKLDEGSKEMLRRYPQTYYITVYPTRRSACYANWIYDNTIKRVMNPKIVGGNIPSVEGAHAQIPFPIPKSGYEVMWNAALKPEQPYSVFESPAWLVDSSGHATGTVAQTVYFQNLYWDNSLPAVPEGKPYYALIAKAHAPASQAGGSQMRWNFLRPDLKSPLAWVYSPGQRRVRQAPEFSYDSVTQNNGGIMLYDEINGFDGKMDRFDFKLVGRKEMYIPYNDYEFLAQDVNKVLTPNHLEPSTIRYELHRVWVVDATLKPGERHVHKQKVFYIDEDSWNMSMMNGFDQSGKIHHQLQFFLQQLYEKPEMRNSTEITNDFSNRSYLHTSRLVGMGIDGPMWGNIKVDAFPPRFFTSENMAGTGLR